ncbi:hypothetical protein DFH09DRAFT_1357495 [Mycena vulgaris]|nr:hypothetical protein DFH09DRAFT_1357495 [Mycena vulgaris]
MTSAFPLMSFAAPLPEFPPFDDSLGAIQIGGICSTFLFGIGTLQTFYYFRQFPKDSALLKGTVALIWVLELGHTVACWHALYSMTVTFYCQPQYLAHPPHSLQVTILFSAPINAIVQIFFANRVRVLSGRWLIPTICWLIILLRAACTFALFWIILNIASLSALKAKWEWLVATGLCLGVAVDGIVAISMCYCLWNARESRFEHTKRMVDTLILWSIETGMVTSGTSIVMLILFLARNDFSWFPFYLILAKLFSNSLLAALNGRQRFRSHPEKNGQAFFDLQFASSTRTRTRPTIQPSISRNRGVGIELSQVAQSDQDLGGGDDIGMSKGRGI